MILDLKNIYKDYQQEKLVVPVLKNVSLQVEEGEYVMAEYIERDELLKFKVDVYDEDGHVLYAVPTGYIVAMPHDDVAPVVHGRWIMHDDEFGLTCECSVCHIETMGDGNYCPNCGAKMDGGVD